MSQVGNTPLTCPQSFPDWECLLGGTPVALRNGLLLQSFSLIGSPVRLSMEESQLVSASFRTVGNCPPLALLPLPCSWHGLSALVQQLSYIVVLSVLDRSLLNRCIENAPGGWEDFVDRFIALISHVVVSTAGLRLGRISEQSRDDIVAEVFLRLIENDFAILRRFRGQSSLGTYLVVVTRRIAIRKLSQYRRAASVARSLVSEPISSDENGQLEVENTEEVQALLAKMPTNEATVIRMYHLEERSYKEISSHVGIPENSVGPLLSKARSRLKTMRDTKTSDL